MMVFSEVHDWQKDKSVKQILVFPSQDAKDSFDDDFQTRVEDHGIEYASDSGIGAMYKLRAVMYWDGKWIPIIRCGVTGAKLWEYHLPLLTADDAFALCKNTLKDMIVKETNWSYWS